MVKAFSFNDGNDGGGYALAALAVFIWAAWLPATRVAVADGITPLDLCLLRYGIPALLLAPVWWRLGLMPKGLPPLVFLAMMGWGAPFVYLISTGLSRASVAHASTLVPCMMPLIAAFGSWIIYGERIARQRLVGMGFIAIAALCVLASVLSGAGTADLGTLGILLLAATGWASYSVAYRRSGLTAMQAAALVFIWSTIIIAPFILLTGSGLPDIPLSRIAFHGTAQGIFSGFIATIAYGLAINRLGMSRAASFSVLVPVLATILAFFWIGERPSALDTVALAIGTIGVAIVNGVFPRYNELHKR